jgi:hypothetical protein
MKRERGGETERIRGRNNREGKLKKREFHKKTM